jgi:hypothetical protein
VAPTTRAHSEAPCARAGPTGGLCHGEHEYRSSLGLGEVEWAAGGRLPCCCAPSLEDQISLAGTGGDRSWLGCLNFTGGCERRPAQAGPPHSEVA